MKLIALLASCLAMPLAAQTPLMDQGRAALSSDPQKAADLLEKAVTQTPSIAEAHYLLGSAYGMLAQHASIFKQPGLASKTRREFDRAVQLDPNHLEARFGLLQFYVIAPGFMGGSDDKAIRQAEEIRKRDAIMGHRAFGFIYSSQKKPDLARREYLDGVREQPNAPMAHYGLAVFYLTSERNYKAAAESFENSVKADPAFMPGWFQIGHMAALTGANLQRGEDALHKYLTYTPHIDEPPLYRAHFWLGSIYEKQGKRTEARQSYNNSLRMNPGQKDVAEALKRVS
jgi:tetratricopeptide (TPR) repeat protein